MDITVNTMMNYYAANNKNKKKRLKNFSLVNKIIYYDKRLENMLNSYSKKIPAQEAILNFNYYIKTLDTLAFGMKKIYQLDDDIICFYINKYLILHKITILGDNSTCIPNDYLTDEYCIELTEVFDKIFCDEILNFTSQILKFQKVHNFLINNKDKYILMMIVQYVLDKHGLLGIKKILVPKGKRQDKTLLKDIAKFINKKFIYQSFLNKIQCFIGSKTETFAK